MYDLKKPHKMSVGLGKPPLIIQNGLVYHRGSGDCLGKVNAHAGHILSGSKSFLCLECGGTFPKRESLEAHMYTAHRDMLMAAVSKKAPKTDDGATWVPTEEMLKEEAKKMTDAQIAAQPEVKESQPTVLDKKPLPSFRERVPAEKTGKHK